MISDVSQLAGSPRLGWIKRKFLEPYSLADWEYRQIPRIHALSAYGWQFAHYTMNLDSGLTFPTSIHPPPLRQWGYSALADNGYNLLWSIRDELILAAQNAGINTGKPIDLPIKYTSLKSSHHRHYVIPSTVR